MTLHFFAKPDTPNNEAIQAFFNNFDLIQQHKEVIYANPEYYNIFIQGCGCFSIICSTNSAFAWRTTKALG